YAPIWSPPTHPQSLNPDTGIRYIDQNADRYPDCPITPLFAAVRTVQPAYPFSSIDIISDRSPLRKLYAFATNDPNLKAFRFGVSVIVSNDGEKTVVFHRREKMTREIEDGGFHGYRKGFEGQYLRSDDEAKGCASLYRIVEYEFRGLKFLMRSAVDGCIPAESSALENFNNAVPTTVEHKGEGDIGKGKGKVVEKSAANNVDALSIIPITNSPPPHHTLLELTTRSKNTKNPFHIASKSPDLYLSQTQHFVEAYYHNPGLRNFEKDALNPGRFAREDVRVSRMDGKLREWEETNGQALGVFRGVLERVLGVVRAEGEGKGKGVCEVRYQGEGGRLVVEEVVEREGWRMREEVGRFF
ncbi:MAG: hypothetical protein Q9180_008701, partial [Flavoplaca navasiana]